MDDFIVNYLLHFQILRHTTIPDVHESARDVLKACSSSVANVLAFSVLLKVFKLRIIDFWYLLALERGWYTYTLYAINICWEIVPTHAWKLSKQWQDLSICLMTQST